MYKIYPATRLGYFRLTSFRFTMRRTEFAVIMSRIRWTYGYDGSTVWMKIDFIIKEILVLIKFKLMAEIRLLRHPRNWNILAVSLDPPIPSRCQIAQHQAF